ncbi:MAG: hypothetical protein ACM3PU_02425, partial [Gemmatimonadota bacterium]
MAADLQVDFTDAERRIVEAALRERYKTAIAVEQVGAEMRLDAESPVLTACPGLDWSARGAHFVVVQVGGERFRSRYFYSPDQLSWTGRPEYARLIDCALDIRRAQADHEREQRGAESGADGGALIQELDLGRIFGFAPGT